MRTLQHFPLQGKVPPLVIMTSKLEQGWMKQSYCDPCVNEVVSATRINEYCKMDFFEEPSDLHGLRGGDSG